MSTVKTAFGGGIPLVDLDQVASIPFCFVGQKGHKFRPSNITDRFCKAMILDHVLDLQTLHADRLVFTDQTCRELMQEVTASISNAGMDLRNFYSCLGTVLENLFACVRAVSVLVPVSSHLYERTEDYQPLHPSRG